MNADTIRSAGVSAGESAVCAHLDALGLGPRQAPRPESPSRIYGANVTIRNKHVAGVTATVYVSLTSDVVPADTNWRHAAVNQLERVCGLDLGRCGYRDDDWVLERLN